MLRAKLINEVTIDDITELNGGVRPSNETMNKNTFFIYSEDDPDFKNLIISRDDFKRDYRWENDRTLNNRVVKV